MAPVSNRVVGIDDDQRFALMKFRRSVKDVLKPEHDDHFLLRWLVARQWDPVAAEKMLRDSMAWREKWDIEGILATWQPPEVLQKYFPSGSTGFDKEGSPVIIIPFVGLDAWGVLHVISRTELIKEIIRHLENYLATARKQAETRGPAALKITSGSILCEECFAILARQSISEKAIVPSRQYGHGNVCFSCGNSILRQKSYRVAAECPERNVILRWTPPHQLTILFDMEGFHIRQYAWKPAAEMVFSLLQIYEANYPEILKSCFIINAPKMFSLAFSIVKKFMHELTLSKIKIFGSDPKKWQPMLFELVDKDQLPRHYGGTLVDDNGDPKCSLIVKQGGKVPKSYYKRKSNEVEKDYTRVTVKTGDKHSFELLCADNESILKWEVGVDSHDIKFLINRRDPEGNETLVHGPKKLSNAATDIGVLPVTGPATYSIVFDNKSSYLRSKKVFYDVVIAVPERDLNLNSLPEDELDSTIATDRTAL